MAGENAVANAPLVQGEAHMRAAVIDGDHSIAVDDDRHRVVAVLHYADTARAQILEGADVDHLGCDSYGNRSLSQRAPKLSLPSPALSRGRALSALGGSAPRG